MVFQHWVRLMDPKFHTSISALRINYNSLTGIAWFGARTKWQEAGSQYVQANIMRFYTFVTDAYYKRHKELAGPTVAVRTFMAKFRGISKSGLRALGKQYSFMPYSTLMRHVHHMDQQNRWIIM
jgi:hypothetical protein